jgi:hypothetical protein
MKIKEEKFVIAKRPNKPLYASFDEWTAHGRTIIDTPDITKAERFVNPSAIMYGLGGHYSGYDAVEVTAVTSYVFGNTLDFPDPKTVFER